MNERKEWRTKGGWRIQLKGNSVYIGEEGKAIHIVKHFDKPEVAEEFALSVAAISQAVEVVTK